MYIDLLKILTQKAVKILKSRAFISSAWEEIAFDWISLNFQ